MVRAEARALFLVSIASVAQTQAQAQAVPADETLNRLIAESLAVRPEVAQALAGVKAAEERIPQAEALPDPMVQLGIQNDGFTSIEVGRMGTSFVSVMASETFPWPGKLGLRRELSELEAASARALVTRARLSTEADVRRAYLSLLLSRDRLALLDQLEGLWQQSLGVARARYEAGSGAQSDVLRAQLELNRSRQRRLMLRAEERSQVQALNRLRARSLDAPIDATSHVRELAPVAALAPGFESAFAPDEVLARSPELSTARLSQARAGRSVALAEKGPYPDLSVGAGLMIRGALPPMWLLTVGGPLPVFAASKQARAVAERQAEADAAREGVAAVEQSLRRGTEERRTELSALLQVIELYEQGLLIQSQATAESTLSQYQVGKASFASVLEANAGFIGDQEGYLASIVSAHRVLIAQVELRLEAPAFGATMAKGAPSPPPAAGATTGAASPSSM